MDSSLVPGTGTRARGGLTYREAHYICRSAVETGRVVSMELVEVNPMLEPENQRELLHGDDKDIVGTETVCLGIELIKSTVGHTLI